jgi:hypothetical protein
LRSRFSGSSGHRVLKISFENTEIGRMVRRPRGLRRRRT